MGRMFGYIIVKHFFKSHILHNIFNKNAIRLIYCCSANMMQFIKMHYPKMLNNKNKKRHLLSNCRYKNKCPFDGKCLMKNVIYRVIVKIDNGTNMIYIGTTEQLWKQGFCNPKTMFNKWYYANSITLSKFICEYKKKYNISLILKS